MDISLPVVVVSLFLVLLALLVNILSRSKQSSASHLMPEASRFDGVSDEDSWEGSFSEARNPKKLSAHLRIVYLDGAGSTSHREIRVQEFDNELHGGILIAHCYLRGAIRTFRFNRIQSCLDAASNEPVDDIASYLNERHARTMGLAS